MLAINIKKKKIKSVQNNEKVQERIKPYQITVQQIFIPIRSVIERLETKRTPIMTDLGEGGIS